MSKYRLYRAMYDLEGKHCGNEYMGEVITCKDCRFWKNEHLCLVMSKYGSIGTKAEHYCSWGERREP